MVLLPFNCNAVEIDQAQKHSFPLKLGWSFFVEGPYSFHTVVGVDQVVVALHLKAKSGLELHLTTIAYGFFELFDGQRGILGNGSGRF